MFAVIDLKTHYNRQQTKFIPLTPVVFSCRSSCLTLSCSHVALFYRSNCLTLSCSYVALSCRSSCLTLSCSYVALSYRSNCLTLRCSYVALSYRSSCLTLSCSQTAVHPMTKAVESVGRLVTSLKSAQETGNSSNDTPANILLDGTFGVLLSNCLVHGSRQPYMSFQALTLNFCIHWPRGPVDLTSYWPAQKKIKKICC